MVYIVRNYIVKLLGTSTVILSLCCSD